MIHTNLFWLGYIILSQELQVIVFLEKSQVCSTRHEKEAYFIFKSTFFYVENLLLMTLHFCCSQKYFDPLLSPAILFTLSVGGSLLLLPCVCDNLSIHQENNIGINKSIFFISEEFVQYSPSYIRYCKTVQDFYLFIRTFFLFLNTLHCFLKAPFYVALQRYLNFSTAWILLPSICDSHLSLP